MKTLKILKITNRNRHAEMKKIRHAELVTASIMLSLILLFSSCSGLFEDDFEEQTNSGTYIMIASEGVAINSRSIDPDIKNSLAKMKNINLFGTKTKNSDGTEFSGSKRKLPQTNNSQYGSLTDLYNQLILLEDGAGTYIFDLSGSIESVYFYQQVTATIEENKTNIIEFNNLVPMKGSSYSSFTPEAEKFPDYGGMDIKLKFSNPNYMFYRVNVTLNDLSKSPDEVAYSGELDISSYTSIHYTRSATSESTSVSASRGEISSGRIAVGEYRITFDFYSRDITTSTKIGTKVVDTNAKQKVNSISYIVRIARGLYSNLEQTVDLNQLYTITYNYNLPLGVSATMTENEYKVNKYSRKSEDIVLPMIHTGSSIFEGWYDEDGQMVTHIPKGSTGDKTFTAHWRSLATDTETLYVDVTNPDNKYHYGVLEDYPLNSLQTALDIIQGTYNQNHHWIIKVKGELTEPINITGDTHFNNYTKSITLEGWRGLDGNGVPQDGLKGGYDSATENGAVLALNTKAPVIIKNLKISGGNNSNTGDIKGGGIYIGSYGTGSSKVNAQVTLDDGALITGNSAAAGSGVYVSSGATLQMGGSAQVAANNDVYLSSGTKIEITNQFEGSVQHAATVTPEVYSVENQVLAMAPNGSGALENECSVFKVTPQIEGDVTTNWEIDTEGKLALATSPNEFFVDTDGDNENSGLDAENALKTIMAAIDKMNDSSTDYVINILGNIWQENMSDEYKLELTDSINGKANSITLRGTSNYEINGQSGGDPTTVMKVTTSVPIIIENITVTGGCATSSYLGGAIYIGEDSTVILGEGTIVNGGGDHGCGSAIYVAASENNGVTKAGTLIMKDDAVVTADNYGEIYLCKGATVKVASALTGHSTFYDDSESPTIAKITPQVYEEGTTVIQLSDDAPANLSISDVYEKFEVFKENDTISWTITNEGKLQKASNGGNSNPEDLVYLSGTNGEELPSNTYWDGEGTNTVGNLYVSKTEITQAEYEKYMTYENGYIPTETGDNKLTYPAYYVSWCEAVIYCNLRSIDEGLTPYYSMDGETDPTKWTAAGVETSDGKCYLPVANITISNYDTPGNNGMWEPTYVHGGGHLEFAEGSTDEGHYGYRLPCGAEWCYIAANSSSLGITDLTTKNVDEWVQAWDEMGSSVGHYHVSGSINGTYNEDYDFSTYVGGDAVPNYAHEGTANIGFRVVRNAPANP